MQMSLALTVTELMNQAWSFNQERAQIHPHAYPMLTLGGTAVLTTTPKLSTVNLLLFLISLGTPWDIHLPTPGRKLCQIHDFLMGKGLKSILVANADTPLEFNTAQPWGRDGPSFPSQHSRG